MAYEPIDPLEQAAGAPDQQPTHRYRHKWGEIGCRSCGALRTHPIHFKDERASAEA